MPTIEWDGNGHSAVRNGRVGDRVVAEVSKKKNHTHTNDDIYDLTVLGQPVKGKFSYIDEVKNAAEEAYFSH